MKNLITSKCKHKVGTYECVYLVHNPKNNKLINIDRCLLPEISSLWNMGIYTIESCCGHTKRNGYIAVYPEYIDQMKKLGYVNDPDAPNNNPCIFLPKTKCIINE